MTQACRELVMGLYTVALMSPEVAARKQAVIRTDTVLLLQASVLFVCRNNATHAKAMPSMAECPSASTC